VPFLLAASTDEATSAPRLLLGPLPAALLLGAMFLLRLTPALVLFRLACPGLLGLACGDLLALALLGVELRLDPRLLGLPFRGFLLLDLAALGGLLLLGLPALRLLRLAPGRLLRLDLAALRGLLLLDLPALRLLLGGLLVALALLLGLLRPLPLLLGPPLLRFLLLPAAAACIAA
jgi:hypothetical protein